MHCSPQKLHREERGSLIVLTLIFGSLFMLLTASLAGFVLVQKKAQFVKENREKAIQIAEAGLEYYNWYLAHNPGDLTHGTGGSGPYDVSYTDPESGTIGAFSLEISGNSYCGELSAVEIESTGYSDNDPSQTRTVYGKYARPSVAEYAYILNSNVWAGDDREIYGRYHSNGGVRMDGTNHSVVTSGVEEWECTSSFGCAASGETKPGVFGDGVNNALWEYPTAPIDFAGITLDLSVMKDAVQDNGGIYLNPRGSGYRLELLSDGSVDIYDVQSTRYVWAYSDEEGTHRSYELIRRERFLENRTIPEDCPIIFVEDDIWLSGVVNGKVSIVSANENSPSINTSVWLSGDITYHNGSGTDGITVIAEENVLIPLIAPDDMLLNGIFIAQKGHFGRHYYTSSGWYDVPWEYDSYVYRNSLTMNGSIVSNGRVGTKWSCGGSYCSGFETRTNTYDRQLATDPPPLTPFTSDDYRFVEWREQE